MGDPRASDAASSPESANALAALQRVTDAALAYLSMDDLLGELLSRVAKILHSDTAAILLLDSDAKVLRARAAKGIEEEVEQDVQIPLGRGFAGRIAAERRAIAIADVDHADILNPILREKGIRSLLGVPLLVEGGVIGVLHVGTLEPRTFDDQHRELLQAAADRVALAVEHAQLHHQREIAETLQRSLLPRHLPEMPGLALAARYIPAAVDTSLGGDWYDVFVLSAGRVGMAIGDVVGHGPRAAMLMAQLRTALRAYALDGHSPAAVADRLNHFTHQLDAPAMTTAAYLVLDPDAETLEMVSAGHPPPLVIGPGGDAAYLPVENDVPLGVARLAHYREQRFDVATGSTVLVFTDGVVEVRGEPLDAGLERLRVVAERGLDPAELCDALVSDVVDGERPADDVAALAVRVLPLEPRLVTQWPAEAEVLSALRHLLRRWLREHGADPDEIYDITVACQEACANAVEHAYAPGPAAFEVEAAHRTGAVQLTVRDRGRWREPRGVHRGRGMPMMRALMDAVEVRGAAEGTAVVLRRSLKGAAQA